MMHTSLQLAHVIGYRAEYNMVPAGIRTVFPEYHADINRKVRPMNWRMKSSGARAQMGSGSGHLEDFRPGPAGWSTGCGEQLRGENISWFDNILLASTRHARATWLGRPVACQPGPLRLSRVTVSTMVSLSSLRDGGGSHPALVGRHISFLSFACHSSYLVR